MNTQKVLTFGADRVTIQTTKNSPSTADTVFGEYFFDHSLSHRHDRSTRKQWRQECRKGCVSERKGAETVRNKRKQVLRISLGQCRKMANYDEFEFRRKPLFYAIFQHFETHSNLSLVRCLTTVIPLYFHFKNWLNFVQQQN